MEGRPASVESVRKIVQDDLAQCDDEQLAAFKKYRVEPYSASIVRYGEIENVIVVAKKENEVIYWEDVEEGFNVSPIATDGKILEHYCNQDDLGLALNTWIPERRGPARVGPPEAV